MRRCIADHAELHRSRTSGSGSTALIRLPELRVVSMRAGMVRRSARGVISPASERSTETSWRTEAREASAVSRTVVSVLRSRSSPPRAKPVAACTLIVVRLWPTRSWSSRARLRRSAATAWAAAMPTSRAWFSAIRRREEASR